MNPKSVESRLSDEEPFEGMQISQADILHELKCRSACPRCGKSRMYFCYTCYVLVPPLAGKVPSCKLPIKVDIIKHKHEIDGKSTSAHAAVLAPDEVNIYTYPNVPCYNTDEKTYLLYPGTQSVTVSQLFEENINPLTYTDVLLADLPPGHNLGTLRNKIVNLGDSRKIHHISRWPIDRIVLIDSTWNQSRGIYCDNRLQALPKIVLQNRPSQFWRHQRGSPRWYLSTIEALHQLLIELHLSAWGRCENYKSSLTLHWPIHKDTEDHAQCSPYSGQYDNLLYFFKFMYEKLHSLYKHEDLLSYKRPMS